MAAAAAVALVVPSWVWATLVMVLFVAVSVATMWLVRYPIRHLPPGTDSAKPRDERRDR